MDIEADGPIPGPYSMVSLGACVAGSYDGATFTAIDPEAHTFYAELKPISDQWDREALRSGPIRETLLAEGADPKAAMTDFVTWVDAQCAAHDRGRAVFAAPARVRLAVHLPLPDRVRGSVAVLARPAHRHEDAVRGKSGLPIHASVKRGMPKELLGSRAHTHNALDDAQGQADLLANLMRWTPTPAPPPAG